MILLIDNYDSFTYNLVHYVEELNEKVEVYRNDKISLKQIRKLKPKKIIISPGPCTPNEAGISLELIKTFYRDIPILGVCLGHQSIGQAFGSKIIRASKIMHGKTIYNYTLDSHNGKIIKLFCHILEAIIFFAARRSAKATKEKPDP